MKFYHGERKPDGYCLVINPNGELLDLRLDLSNHSPKGFDWGYHGSGPAQLALAILADYLKDDKEAFAYYQKFKEKMIAGIQSDEWQLTESEIASALEKIKSEMVR